MRLLAISDLHLSYDENRRALTQISPSKDDWLILAGDVGETRSHLEFAFSLLSPRFQRLVWVPGNHELWTLPSERHGPRGQFKYEELINLCRTYNVLTPEDPYPVITIGEQEVRIAPLFLLYDYSFRPKHVSLERAVRWAMEGGTHCMDEEFLHPEPYSGIAEWCRARCALTEKRLECCNDGRPLVLINHFPLREDVASTPDVPRFSIWCGTRRSEDWHLRFNAAVVVSGHLHVRSTKHRDGIRFEEVSLGYPKQWRGIRTPNDCVREILPAVPVQLQSE